MALTGIPLDTSLEALRVQSEILRAIGIEGRAKVLFDLNAQARALCEAGVRKRHPEYTDDQIRLARIRLTLGDELFRKVYPGVELEP
jgi:hypothetical protein